MIANINRLVIKIIVYNCIIQRKHERSLTHVFCRSEFIRHYLLLVLIKVVSHNELSYINIGHGYRYSNKLYYVSVNMVILINYNTVLFL